MINGQELNWGRGEGGGVSRDSGNEGLERVDSYFEFSAASFSSSSNLGERVDAT